MEAKEAFDTRPQGFCDDLAIAAIGEAIDHDAVETGQGAHLPRAIAQEGGHGFGLRQTRHHGADGAARLHFVMAGRFRFDDDRLAGKMNGHIEFGPVLDQRNGKQPLDRVRPAQ